MEEFARNLTNTCIEILLDKSTKYNPDGNYVGTFEFAARLSGVSTPQAIISRMGDKITRLSSLLSVRSGRNLEESEKEALDDAILDLINYLILMKWAIK